MVAVASSRSNSTAARRSASFAHLASAALSSDEVNDEDDNDEEDDDDGGREDGDIAVAVLLERAVALNDVDMGDEPTAERRPQAPLLITLASAVTHA